MSHLGDRLSALVDGELGHDERDRMHAHLAACPQCRADATALRALKRRVAALGDMAMDPQLFSRLVSLGAPGGPVPVRPRAFPGSGPRPAMRVYPRTQGPGRTHRSRRGRYAAAASLLVLLLGALSFLVGGAPAARGPRIAPPVGTFTVEHSVTTGGVPSVGPTAGFLRLSPAGHRGP